MKTKQAYMLELLYKAMELLKESREVGNYYELMDQLYLIELELLGGKNAKQ